jgi:hypothetical protein
MGFWLPGVSFAAPLAAARGMVHAGGAAGRPRLRAGRRGPPGPCRVPRRPGEVAELACRVLVVCLGQRPALRFTDVGGAGRMSRAGRW